MEPARGATERIGVLEELDEQASIYRHVETWTVAKRGTRYRSLELEARELDGERENTHADAMECVVSDTPNVRQETGPATDLDGERENTHADAMECVVSDRKTYYDMDPNRSNS